MVVESGNVNDFENKLKAFFLNEGFLNFESDRWKQMKLDFCVPDKAKRKETLKTIKDTIVKDQPGVYVIRNLENKKVIYIGTSENIQDRILRHYRKMYGNNGSLSKGAFLENQGEVLISWSICTEVRMRGILERVLKLYLNPIYDKER
ncbi:GIY-YIG nuclease family protein [Bacillus toyonensis]|uniref:GIY-YIG nuclease family protein n=1 Tax=Bacillus toyonensis TaxID=155322 RepID=UPI002E1D9EA9|nr:GIY-YIG nuclease family protein [Bacillus toyonensis]